MRDQQTQKKSKRKITIKAVALSALVLPGAGHIYLKRYITAIPFIGAALICTYMLGTRILSSAKAITDNVIQNNVAVDTTAISKLLEQQLALLPSSEIELINRISIILLITWVVAIIDCLRIPNTVILENYKSE